MWPFTKEPKPLVLIVTKVESNDDWRNNTSWPLVYSFRCLVCDRSFVRLGTIKGSLEYSPPNCTRCGARRTLKEIQTEMRRDREIELLTEQTQKRIEALRVLRALQEEEEIMKKGIKRIVEA